MNLKLKILVLFLLTLLFILPFQNCSNGFKALEGASNFAFSEEYCKSEYTQIESLQSMGVNAQRLEFCNFRNLSKPVTGVTFGYVNKYIVDSHRVYREIMLPGTYQKATKEVVFQN